MRALKMMILPLIVSSLIVGKQVNIHTTPLYCVSVFRMSSLILSLNVSSLIVSKKGNIYTSPGKSLINFKVHVCHCLYCP